ncbi:hypothetical protein F4808DRAFT_358465 [Astrocystis sublimbata]|nr:hypothetical protein F4808DRAFT_358465 [Astrocystis sublimbata]
MKGGCFPFVLLAVWAALGRLGIAEEIRRRDDADGSEIPSAHDFVRRGCSSVAVLGDYLYIDGGQVTERVNDSNPADSPSFDAQTTWSIDLTEAWTPEKVSIRSIPKAAPLLNEQVHWTDPSTSSLYTWGGITSNGSSPDRALWRLRADGSGGGSWTQVTQRDFLNFSKLKGIFGSAFTQTKDTGFAFGGAVTKASDDSVTKEVPGYATPGLISYNFKTGEWDNSTTTFYGGYGTSLNARAEYVPFGPNGLLMFLGGAESPVDTTNETIAETSWNSITMVDPVTKQWHRQSTSGIKPPTIESHCSVGVPGPNGTYEIFIYGGVSDQLRGTSSEVYVLSLPGFVFFKGPTDAPPRSDHQCAIVGEGKRQMLSFGGIDGENRTFTAPRTADPWPYGIGILDMTELEWTHSYDPEAAAYDTPTVVKEWYDDGNLKNVNWDNEDVEALFMKQDADPKKPAPPQNSTTANAHSTSAIVGGAVGGVVGAVAIGMMSFMLVRRRIRQRANTPDSGDRSGPGDSESGEIAEYKPEPWPKDHEGPRHTYSPESMFGIGSVHSGPVSPQPQPYQYTYPQPLSLSIPQTHAHPQSNNTYKPQDIGPSELSGHQDGIVPIHGGELPGSEPRVGELMDPNIMQWAHELPAPLSSPRTELPDRKYSH